MQQDQLSGEYIKLVCQKMVDNDSFVQEAACTALCVAIEHGPDQIVTNIGFLLEAFKIVIDVYSGAALVSLLDAIGQLAQTLGDLIKDERIIGELLPLLNRKWISIDDNSNTLFPLFETYESLVSSLGVYVLPFAEPIFQRACKILANYVASVKVRKTDDEK